MSATGRSDCRRADDHYVTPDWCVRRLFERYDMPAAGLIMDPCAANGELLSVVPSNDNHKLYAVELRAECQEPLSKVAAGVIIGDFLAMAKDVPEKFVELVVSNPPYSLAQEFIEHSLSFSKRVVMLLRLNFLAGRERREFIARTRPGILVLPNRPSFTGTGSDACEYGWFIFGDERWAGSWDVLNTTDKAELAAWNKRARIIHNVEAVAA